MVMKCAVEMFFPLRRFDFSLCPLSLLSHTPSQLQTQLSVSNGGKTIYRPPATGN